jgi:hypothetical protein
MKKIYTNQVIEDADLNPAQSQFFHCGPAIGFAGVFQHQVAAGDNPTGCGTGKTGTQRKTTGGLEKLPAREDE